MLIVDREADAVGAPFDATRSPRHERRTTQVQNVVKILGLRFGTKYTAENIKTLRYGHLMIMTDQDHDGYCTRRRISPFRGAAAPPRRRRASSSREEAVGGFVFDVEADVTPSRAGPTSRAY